MTIAGELDIRVTADGARIASTRPLGLAATFTGRAPADVVALVPLVYGICGMAQGVAAVRACERALGIEAAPGVQRGRDLLVMAETAREHLLRITGDWTRAAGREVDAGVQKRVMLLDRRWRKALGAQSGLLALGASVEPDPAEVAPLIRELAALMTEVVLGERPRAWLARGSRAALGEWAQERTTAAAGLMRRLIDEQAFELGTVPLYPLPRLEEGALANILLGPSGVSFVAAPAWEGRPRETTPLARCATNPLLASLASTEGFGLGARLAARLVELAALTGCMELALEPSPAAGERPKLPPGTGIAQVEAARGRLIHAVAVADGKISAYRILAPTEWNFHPQGAALRALQIVAGCGRTHAAQLADLMVTAFDPCVACRLEVG